MKQFFFSFGVLSDEPTAIAIDGMKAFAWNGFIYAENNDGSQ